MRMHLASAITAITSSAAPASPADRLRAADRLAYLAGVAAETAELAAARFDASGTQVTRRDLLADLFARVTPVQLGAALDDAIEGALAVAPDEAWRRPDLRSANDALLGVLFAAAEHTTRGRAWHVYDELFAELEAATAPLFAASAAIAPPQA
jgi:hypothetical protein